jgi:hypothetical protein
MLDWFIIQLAPGIYYGVAVVVGIGIISILGKSKDDAKEGLFSKIFTIFFRR